MYGDGSQSRDFTYVDNVVRGIRCALGAPDRCSGEVYNIACGERVSLLALHGAIAELTDGCPPPCFGPERPGDVPHSHACIDAARRDLGFEPVLGFADGLSRTVDWYRDHFALWNAMGGTR